jgi:RsiW-degrading membrane proteinase PrsW (M82 family)
MQKDLHPEPKRMVLKVFLLGALITIPVYLVQAVLALAMEAINLSPLASNFIKWFVIIGFSEELFKYLVVKFAVFNSQNLDEPLDLMLYMVISALGFAALENILYLFPSVSNISFDRLIYQTSFLTLVRSLTAVFLHTLCSAIVGYFLAMAFCQATVRRSFIVLGLLTATVLHGLYDFFIITLQGYIKIIFPIIIILILAVLVFSEFSKLQKLKGICKLN